MMFFSWVFYTVAIFTIIYLIVKLNYTKSLYMKETNVNSKQTDAIKDAQLLIRKYRTQLQRSIGNIDILTEELNKIRNDVKSCGLKTHKRV